MCTFCAGITFSAYITLCPMFKEQFQRSLNFRAHLLQNLILTKTAIFVQNAILVQSTLSV